MINNSNLEHILGCEYGDMFSWCPSYVLNNAISGTNCSNLGDDVAIECCYSCNTISIMDSTSGLSTPSTTQTVTKLQADDAQWCASSFPGICYDSDTRIVCPMFCEENFSSEDAGKVRILKGKCGKA